MRHPNWNRAGLTLVEVVAAMALVGTLLVFMVRASTQFQRRSSEFNTNAKALRLTDQLVASWVSSQDGIPHSSFGNLTESVFWKTTLLGPVPGLPEAIKVKLSVFKSLRNSSFRELFTIELLDHVEVSK